jgi:hypothetical protein
MSGFVIFNEWTMVNKTRLYRTGFGVEITDNTSNAKMTLKLTTLLML